VVDADIEQTLRAVGLVYADETSWHHLARASPGAGFVWLATKG
jgi:hypothetical protein